MLKHALSGTELQFSVRRERNGRYVAVSGDAGVESLVVTASTLKDLHISLADRVTVKYGPNVRIRLLVGRQILTAPRVGPKQAQLMSDTRSDHGATAERRPGDRSRAHLPR
jgi:hypothetical protein